LLSESEKKNVQVLTISTDPHDEAKIMYENIKYNQPGKLDFPLLSDYDHKVIDAYGIRNPADPEAARRGMPYTATYIINKEGVVAHRFLDPTRGFRPTNEQIREELKKIGAVR
jgi:peroxiredoxin